MESVGQWNMLANHVANRINQELLRQHYLNASLYVRQTCGMPGSCGSNGAFPFDEGFSDLLTTQLVNFGIPTVTTPENARLVVEYEVQTVYHPPENNEGGTAFSGLGFSAQPKGQYELIVTTTIVDGNRYVMRSSDIYSINATDFWHYRQAAPAAEIRLTGSRAISQPVPTTKTPL